MLFADDMLLFSKGDMSSIRALAKTFDEFSKTSGLIANCGKSCVYLAGVQEQIKAQISYE